MGVKTAQSYRSITLKRKLQKKFGERISIINQTGGSAFICASFIPLGNALEKLRQLEAQSQVDETNQILQRAAKILRCDIKKCRKERREDQSTEVSYAAAEKIVPDSLFNFTAMLLCDKPKVPNKEESVRVLVDLETGEKALIISQQILQHVGAAGNCYNLPRIQPDSKQISDNTQQQTRTRDQL